MDGGIIAAIISGGCALSALLLERYLKVVCPVHEDSTGNEIEKRKWICKPRYCQKPIPDTPAPSQVLDVLFEPPFTRDQYTYTEITTDNYYSVRIPPCINMVYDNKIVDNGCVNIYKEIFTKPASGIYFLDIELENISPGQVKLFIKRFDDNWTHAGPHPCEFLTVVNGINNFEADSHIGTDGVTKEQVGIAIYAKKNQVLGDSTCIIKKVYLQDRPLNGYIL